MNETLGKLYVVGTPIGNLNDLSYRAQETLKQVDWIASEDTRVTKKLLDHYHIQTELISLHKHNEHQKSEFIQSKIQQGDSVALVSDAGTPCISDPGSYLIQHLHKENILVVPIPGPCAAITALSVSGILNNDFIFLGFLPSKSQARQKKLFEISKLPYTLIFYEAPHRIKSMLVDCLETLGAERGIVIGRELTKKFESIYTGSLGEIVELINSNAIPEKGEFVVLVEAFEKDATAVKTEDQEAKRVLALLIEQLPVKQAVQTAVRITGYPKNKLYDWAIDLKN